MKCFGWLGTGSWIPFNGVLSSWGDWLAVMTVSVWALMVRRPILLSFRLLRISRLILYWGVFLSTSEFGDSIIVVRVLRRELSFADKLSLADGFFLPFSPYSSCLTGVLPLDYCRLPAEIFSTRLLTVEMEVFAVFIVFISHDIFGGDRRSDILWIYFKWFVLEAIGILLWLYFYAKL